MSSYSSFEKSFASFLSRFPRSKSLAKRIYSHVFYMLYKTDDDYIINSDYRIYDLGSSDYDTFFGYYDKSPESPNGNYILLHRVKEGTRKLPSCIERIEIIVQDRLTGEVVFSCDTRAFNWQQGSKLQWLSNEQFIFNDYEKGQYVSRIVDLSMLRVFKTLPMPIYDTYVDKDKKVALTTSFERLAENAPDYGYFSHERKQKSDNHSDGGIYFIDIDSSITKELVSLEHISNFEFDETIEAVHTINHIMISPDSSKFIFIHRWYVSGRRYDRLIMSDFNGNIEVLVSENMVSHCCWKDEKTVVGYFEYESERSYFSIDILENNISKYTNRNLPDGHPTILNGKMLTDTYPNRRGLQELIVLDEGDRISTLGQFRHSPDYFGERRCDLHPRYNKSGNRIYFDSVCKGVRKLFYIEKNE